MKKNMNELREIFMELIIYKTLNGNEIPQYETDNTHDIIVGFLANLSQEEGWDNIRLFKAYIEESIRIYKEDATLNKETNNKEIEALKMILLDIESVLKLEHIAKDFINFRSGDEYFVREEGVITTNLTAETVENFLLKFKDVKEEQQATVKEYSKIIREYFKTT